MYNEVNRWEDDDYCLLLEDQQGFLFAHCYVYEEKLSTMKKIKKVCKEVLEWAYSEGYDGVHTYTENKKFAETLPNARHLEDFEEGGRLFGVYKWELK